jgi:hypothetical protein
VLNHAEAHKHGPCQEGERAQALAADTVNQSSKSSGVPAARVEAPTSALAHLASQPIASPRKPRNIMYSASETCNYCRLVARDASLVANVLMI